MKPEELCVRLEAIAVTLDLADDSEAYLVQEAADLIKSRQHAYVGSTQEIWDAINVDLQQIVDDVSAWEGRHAERMCENLEAAIKRLNAAVSHERAGYETAIAAGYTADKLSEELEALKKEDRQIRRLFCSMVADRPYMDDGEASDQEIDYLRDSAEVLCAKIRERNIKKLKGQA